MASALRACRVKKNELSRLPGEVRIRFADDPLVTQQDEPQAPIKQNAAQAREYSPEEQLANKRIAGARRFRR